MHKDVKFQFYKLEYELESNLQNFSLDDYFNAPLNLQGHLLEIGDHKAFLEKKHDNIYSFQKFRKDFVPQIKDEKTGTTRDIKLKSTEYLIEEVYLYMDIQNKVVIMQKNNKGYSTGRFEEYIICILKNKFKDDIFRLKPIILESGVEDLYNNIVKSFELKVSAHHVGILNDIGIDPAKIKNINIDKMNTIEIKITSKMRKGGIFGKLKDFMDTISFDKNKNNVDKARITTSTSHEGTGQMFDLLDDTYVITARVQQQKNNKSVDITSIVNALKNIYQENISKVEGYR